MKKEIFKEIIKATLRVTATLSEIITIIFFILKLLRVIKFSWLWVLSPIWIQLILVALEIVIFAGMNVIERRKKEV